MALVSTALALAPAALAETPAAAPPGEPIAVELRIPATGAAWEALAWRAGDDFLVEPQALRSLGVTTNAAEGDAPIALSSVRGLSFAFDPAQQAIDIACTSACYARQVLGPRATEQMPIASGRGAFLNVDLVGSHAGNTDAIAGGFDLGLFQPGGYGGARWTMSAGDQARFVRLDTYWAMDFPQTRARLSLGDSVAHSSGTGIPFRFAGVQWATDFSIDPTFVSFPTQTFLGDAAMPSAVDLYIDDALRVRENVEAGPFEIDDVPIVEGAGVARIVVTDALGRQQVINAPFYSAPELLKPGLSDYAFAAGAERLSYAQESADYGRGFVLGSYRRGLTDWLTAEARVEGGENTYNVGGGVSLAWRPIGQVDASLARSEGDNGQGEFASVGWSRSGDVIVLSAQLEAAGDGFARIGQDGSLPERRGRATIGFDLDRYGAVSMTAAVSEKRAQERVETFNINYSAPATPLGAFSVSALFVENGESFTGVTISLVRPLGPRTSGAVSAEVNDGRATVSARAQSAAPPDEGLGWRAAISQGDIERFDGGIAVRRPTYEGRLEASSVRDDTGLRAQYATGLVWIDDSLHVSRPIRESFALVHLDAPDVDVFRDRLPIGRTDASGRLLVTGLRPYDVNRLGIDIDDLPLSAEVADDEISFRPAARSGAVVRFPLRMGSAGEVQIVDAAGAPLAEGTMLVREGDGARFPVGRNGRAYISGLADQFTLAAQAPTRCRVLVNQAALTAGRPLTCQGAAA